MPNFRLRMSVNGSDGLFFAPLGEVTVAKIKSTWPHPSFQGAILPKESNITSEGFTARWQIPNLARNYPQAWQQNQQQNLINFTTGVKLFEPVSLYSTISRATKYGILFIALTFVTFLIFELTVKTRPHFIQYALIGLALSLFYLILLSLAEHVKFLEAYISASLVTISLITLYSAAVLKSFSRGIIIFLLLASLYAVLYILLHMEDYALLAGSGLLLIVLSVLMFVTRNIQND